MKTAEREDVAYIIGNDVPAATSLKALLDTVKIEPRIFSNPIEFLRSFVHDKPCCIIMEMRMPRLTGLELLAQLRHRQTTVPAIVVTAYGEVTSAVRAMKLGAADFFEKPVNEELLLECIQHWLKINRTELHYARKRSEIEAKLASLSPREMEVLVGVLNGKSNKEIANDLNVTPKAIELYRSKLMSKMGAPSLAALIRETLCSSVSRVYQCDAATLGDRTRFQCPSETPVNVQDACSALIKSSRLFKKSCQT